DFARGPALQWSLIILVVGVLWRLFGALFLLRHKDLSKPKGETGGGAVLTVLNRFWPKPQFSKITFTVLLAYVMHIGLFVVVFLFAPHITLIKDMTGLSWGGLPNSVIMFAGTATIAAMAALLVRRMTTPVLRMISSWEDYFSWAVTAAPVLTGMLAYAHVGGRYENLLAVHLLTVELLFVWFPFGKLMHAVLFIPSRAQLGAHYARRGVKI
ncbi:MAG: nitrate reductase, partial [Chromatiales bacterium]